jgi:hypothetical protein
MIENLRLQNKKIMIMRNTDKNQQRIAIIEAKVPKVLLVKICQ